MKTERVDAAGQQCPQALGGDIGRNMAVGKVASGGEGQSDSGVEVRSGDMAGGVDHGHDDQAEGGGDADVGYGPARDLVDGHGAAAAEDDGEGAGTLGGAFSQQVHCIPIEMEEDLPRRVVLRRCIDCGL